MNFTVYVLFGAGRDGRDVHNRRFPNWFTLSQQSPIKPTKSAALVSLLMRDRSGRPDGIKRPDGRSDERRVPRSDRCDARDRASQNRRQMSPCKHGSLSGTRFFFFFFFFSRTNPPPVCDLVLRNVVITLGFLFIYFLAGKTSQHMRQMCCPRLYGRRPPPVFATNSSRHFRFRFKRNLYSLLKCIIVLPLPDTMLICATGISGRWKGNRRAAFRFVICNLPAQCFSVS